MNESPEHALALVTDCEPSGPFNAETAGKLAQVRNAILAGLAKDETLTEKVATSLLDAIEIKVRLGWLINWSHAYLVGRGNWVKWLQENFAISQPTLNRYGKFANHFAPDIQAVQERKRLGIEVKGLAVAPAEALRTQISLCGFRSFSEALRLTGLRPPLPAEVKALGNGAKNKESADDQLRYILEGLKFLEKRLRAVDPGRLTQEEREQLFDHLSVISQQLEQFGEPTGAR